MNPDQPQGQPQQYPAPGQQGPARPSPNQPFAPGAGFTMPGQPAHVSGQLPVPGIPGGQTSSANQKESKKSYVTAVVLSWLLGIFGADRFYLGYTTLGVLKLVTLGGLGVWAITDFILIISGNVKDSDGLTLAGYAKNKIVGFILLGISILLVIASLLTLPARLRSSNATPTTSGQNTQVSASIGGDPKRQNDIQELQSFIEIYGNDHHQYPTLTNVNDPDFRKANFGRLDPASYKDPDGSSDKLATAPQPNAYAYMPAPAGCDDVKTPCTSYVLTATLSNGQPYSVQSFGLQ